MISIVLVLLFAVAVIAWGLIDGVPMPQRSPTRTAARI
ncbi:putative membrane protein [Mycobacterium xenopi 4042]|uniref:Putative membrane protein n=1 Tax=Mycobacterium xenopi 4042 TaxID=1299334 RepID=X7ZN08_MYCXE|nr:putative membrane protein [Mycobacterium xenopi 4042]